MSDLYSETPQHDLEHTQVNLTSAADIPVPPLPPLLPRKHMSINYAVKPVPRRSRTPVYVITAFALTAILGIISLGAVVFLSADPPRLTPTPLNLAALSLPLPTAVDARVFYDPATLATTPTALPAQATDTAGYNAWDGTSRLTVLVMGLDRRPGYTGLAYRTDTMMIVSLDPETDTLGILSIPRDLYVNVPGYSALQRINTPMVLGEYDQQGSGPELAMQTVQYNFGIRIHDYIIVDFEAVTTLVDAIGGIEVDVPNAIADWQFPDMNEGYDPLVLNAGLQTMDGETALKYARTRHGDSDFQRAERQQQVLFAVRDQVLSRDAIPGLILQAPSLYGSLSQDIATNLTLDQMIQLGLYLRDIPLDNIHTGVIDINYVMGYTTEEGAQVLIPNRALLADLFIDVFGESYGE